MTNKPIQPKQDLFNPDLWHLPKDKLLGFREVPAGPFPMGSSDADPDAYLDEKPQHTVTLPTYYMARWPVTNAQWAAFYANSGHDYGRDLGLPDHPVVNVTWHDAMAYCEWLDCQLRDYAAGEQDITNDFWGGLIKANVRITLPSEVEWEKAARGTDGRIYPWGNQHPHEDENIQRCNCFGSGNTGTTSVAAYPDGASPYDCEDMSGNVWEWTRSYWKDSYADGAKADESRRVLRGGAFYSDPRGVRAAFRYWGDPGDWDSRRGFRVVVSPLNSDR